MTEEDDYVDIEEIVTRYMSLRISGIGVGLTDNEIQWLNGLPKEVWKDVEDVIKELGDKVAGVDGLWRKI